MPKIIADVLFRSTGPEPKGVAEREPVTRRRGGGVLPKSELLYYPMSDASKPCLKLYLSPSPC